MISEKQFTRNDFQRLMEEPHRAIRVEMAAIKEWVVRDPGHPDVLLLVYVSAFPDGTINAACSCINGAQDKTCLHALKVINEIKAQGHLLQELFRPKQTAAA